MTPSQKISRFINFTKLKNIEITATDVKDPFFTTMTSQLSQYSDLESSSFAELTSALQYAIIIDNQLLINKVNQAYINYLSNTDLVDIDSLLLLLSNEKASVKLRYEAISYLTKQDFG